MAPIINVNEAPVVDELIPDDATLSADAAPSTGAFRVRIRYQDEQLRQRCEQNLHNLLRTAMDGADATSTSAILARKALRYRRIPQRLETANVDVRDPAFDASASLGVRWQSSTDA